MTQIGRPSEYKEEYIERVDDYLKTRSDGWEIKYFDYKDSEGEDQVKVDPIYSVKLPTIEGFALFIGVNKTSLYEWEKKHPLFSNALNKIRTEQQERLINSGLAGKYNSTIAKLILSSNHGMSEKQIVDNNITGSISLTDLFNKAKE